MNVLREDKKLAIISAMVEGMSIRGAERMTGVHRDTIMRLLVRVGHRCDELTAATMHGVRARYIQADEIWTFVGKKQRRLAGPELERGDQYVFVAIDAQTKLVPAFIVGKRERGTACSLMEQLRDRLAPGELQITTDDFKAYRDAIDFAFGPVVDYGTESKQYAIENDPGRGRYAPPSVSRVVKKDVYGSPVREHVSTAYVERNNWTMRTSLRRMTRLSNGFSRKLDNLRAALSLYFCWYNYCRHHRSLGTTPAVAAGIATRVWSLGELMA